MVEDRTRLCYRYRLERKPFMSDHHDVPRPVWLLGGHRLVRRHGTRLLQAGLARLEVLFNLLRVQREWGGVDMYISIVLLAWSLARSHEIDLRAIAIRRENCSL